MSLFHKLLAINVFVKINHITYVKTYFVGPKGKGEQNWYKEVPLMFAINIILHVALSNKMIKIQQYLLFKCEYFTLSGEN